MGYNISCIVPYGTTFVFFPTWSMNNGSDDVEWHMGTVTNGTTGSIHINTADHNNDSGIYVTHIYAYDAYMNPLASYQSVFVDINRYITNIQVSNKTSTGYTVTCTLPTGTKVVRFPTWTIANNQDDLLWYIGNINGTIASKRINISNHNNEKGTYVTDIYAYDSEGNILDNGRTIVNMQ